MRVLVINNIKAGFGDTSLYDFLRSFARDGDEIVMRTTDTTTRIEDMLDDAGDFDAVVAAGGDGTVTSVCYELRNTGIPILPYPSGTANLFAINLDYPVDPPAFAKLLRACQTMDFDVGELHAGDFYAGFENIAGAGYDAAIMEGAKRLKPVAGESSYLLAALGDPAPKPAHFTLDLDGVTVERDGIAALLVNFGKMAIDISVTPENNPRDGFFEVAIIKPRSMLQLLPAVISAWLDREGKDATRGDSMEIFYAHEVTVEADPPLKIQYDGEVAGVLTPFHARSFHRAVRMIVDPDNEIIKKMAAL